MQHQYSESLTVLMKRSPSITEEVVVAASSSIRAATSLVNTKTMAEIRATTLAPSLPKAAQPQIILAQKSIINTMHPEEEAATTKKREVDTEEAIVHAAEITREVSSA
jgi:hypothetical protein